MADCRLLPHLPGDAHGLYWSAPCSFQACGQLLICPPGTQRVRCAACNTVTTMDRASITLLAARVPSPTQMPAFLRHVALHKVVPGRVEEGVQPEKAQSAVSMGDALLDIYEADTARWSKALFSVATQFQAKKYEADDAALIFARFQKYAASGDTAAANAYVEGLMC